MMFYRQVIKSLETGKHFAILQFSTLIFKLLVCAYTYSPQYSKIKFSELYVYLCVI
jgi:hypothetical protein